MARKRTLSTLDTSIAYEAVGLDLAKEDVALAAFDSEHKEPYLIDRIPYDKLYELLADMAPTWLPWSHAAVLIRSPSRFRSSDMKS